MPSTKSVPHPVERQPSVLYENNPELGDFTFRLGGYYWTNRRVTINGNYFKLLGHGPQPSAGQIEFWRELEPRLSDLEKAAIQAVKPPFTKGRRYHFSTDDLTLREVRLEQDGTVEIWLNSPLEDEIEMAPFVTFHDWKVVSAEWAV